MRSLAVKRLTVYPLALAMRRRVSHAASERAVSEPIVAAIELMDGTVGYGETLPRTYVTGESSDTVVELLRGEFTKQLLAIRPSTFPDVWEMIEALPLLAEDGHACPAARACVELALIDAYLRCGGRDLGDAVTWMGLPGFGHPGSIRVARYGIVLASRSVRSLQRNLRLARLAGMRHFKLKVGMADDVERRVAVLRVLRHALQRDRVTLRLDANGAWTLDEAVEALAAWQGVPVAGVEQPLAKGAEDELVELRQRTGMAIIHDESLVTMDDAVRLHELGVADVFNVRISKCGGLMPSLRIAAFARARGIAVQLGCMVGETGILSSAGVRFLQQTPGVAYCEGAYGSLLLAEDVTRRNIRFGLGGKPPRVLADGLVTEVSPEALRAHCIDDPIVIEL